MPHNNIPNVLEDNCLRKYLQDDAAKVAAVIDHYSPWIVDIEELEMTLQSKKHVPDL